MHNSHKTRRLARSLQQSDGFLWISEEVNTLVQQVKNEAFDGSKPIDREEYLHRRGYIEGLQKVLSTITEVADLRDEDLV